MKLEFTNEQLDRILGEASAAAIRAGKSKYDEMGGDRFMCGFAWVDIYGIRANSKLGKQLESFGIKKDSWKKAFSVWDPAGLPVQNIDIKEAGADAFARVLESYGFTAYAGSRLD
jgi:pantothenate kinase type III